jgi:hypothetical protein
VNLTVFSEKPSANGLAPISHPQNFIANETVVISGDMNTFSYAVQPDRAQPRIETLGLSFRDSVDTVCRNALQQIQDLLTE